ERLLRSLKTEWIPPMGYHSLAAARKDISSYLMGYYNQERPHALNGGTARVVAEEKLKTVCGISGPLHKENFKALGSDVEFTVTNSFKEFSGTYETINIVSMCGDKTIGNVTTHSGSPWTFLETPTMQENRGLQPLSPVGNVTGAVAPAASLFPATSSLKNTPRSSTTTPPNRRSTPPSTARNPTPPPGSWRP